MSDKKPSKSKIAEDRAVRETFMTREGKTVAARKPIPLGKGIPKLTRRSNRVRSAYEAKPNRSPELQRRMSRQDI